MKSFKNILKKPSIKLLLVLGTVIVVVLIIAWIFMQRSGKLVFIQNSQPKINPVSTVLEPLNNNISPRDPNLTNEQNLVKDYLNSRLSELSPTKEVLGGKFQITKIDFVGAREANISYEDGHIALEANVKYSLDAQQLKVESFKITKEN
jgi:hypothetical protein